MNDITEIVCLRVKPQGEHTLHEAVTIIDEQYARYRECVHLTRFRLELNVTGTVAMELFAHPSLLGHSDLVLTASEVPWTLSQ